MAKEKSGKLSEVKNNTFIGSERVTGIKAPVTAFARESKNDALRKNHFSNGNDIGAASQTKTSILVVDDHVLLAEMVAKMLPNEAPLLVHIAKDLEDGLNRIDENGGYDVVLLDVSLPQRLSIGEVKSVVEKNSQGQVVLFSGSVSREFVNKTLSFGAMGMIPKTLPLRSIVSAIQLVASGEPFVPVGYISIDRPLSSPSASHLNDVEIEMLQKLGEGLSNKEIMAQLQLPESTVKMRVRSLCRKLDAKNRTHAVILGREMGILL